MKLFLLLCISVVSDAQIFTLTRDQLIKFTGANPFDRFPDGRPKVPNELLEKCKGLSIEEVWAVLPEAGYPNQYEGDWKLLHPGQKLVGRVVTAQFMPMRPDVMDVAETEAKSKGLGKNANQRFIDSLQPGDVAVVDLFGKVEGGTFVGDNLATAIFARTGNGFVVDGSIRDLEGIFEIPMASYYRDVHPSAIRNVMLTAVNVPIRIGHAAVMPGDVAFGDRGGVYFIPPHLVKKVLDKADVTHIHDEWTKKKFLTGKFKSSEIYPSPSSPELIKEYEEYLKEHLKK